LGVARLQNGLAPLQNAFTALQNGLAPMQNAFAALFLVLAVVRGTIARLFRRLGSGHPLLQELPQRLRSLIEKVTSLRCQDGSLKTGRGQHSKYALAAADL